MRSTIEILRQTELNIKFYLDNGMTLHAHNEIGVMRGLIYALYGDKSVDLTDLELNYIQLQNAINENDKELKR